MTVKDLKNKLSDMPDSMDVFIAEPKTEFSYGLANSIYRKEIAFMEDLNSEVMATAEVVIIDEE